AVGAQLQIDLSEQVGLGIVDLWGTPRPRIKAVLSGQDLLHRVEPLLRDPDTGGVARGAELDARGERTVVMTEVTGHEEVQPVADDRAAQRETVLLLLVVGHGYRHAVGIAAHEILILQVSEYRPVELVGAGFGDGVDQAADETALPHVERSDQDLILLYGFDRERPGVDAAAGNRIARAQREEIVVDGAGDLDV